MIEQNDFNREMLAFLRASPTPYHAVTEVIRQLKDAGFEALEESDAWELKAGGKYYVQRAGSSIAAFVYGKDSLVDNGWRMWGAHTDSPCLKLKPKPDLESQGYRQWGVQVYGGALLNPWFDRDLSLAGRVHFRDAAGKFEQCLIDLERPVAIIPSLAIHLDREVNNTRSVNPQTDMVPIIGLLSEKDDLDSLLKHTLLEQGKNVSAILDSDLSLYDVQAPSMVGWRNEFIASARLDNLLSCFVGLKALMAADGHSHCVLVCNDHEEVGSISAVGAQGPMLQTVLQRISRDYETMHRALNRSLMISADNAHGVHPNYADKHDKNHGPKLNAGPVIKINANQRYASTSETNTMFSSFCQECDVPVQQFVVRNDMACGSTIGPITSAELGVKTIDIGVPTFAMHSCRELAGSDDARNLAKVGEYFFLCRELPKV